MDDSKTFALKSTDQSFRERQRNVFDRLSALETTLPSADTHDMEVDDTSTSPQPKTRHLRGKESIFKRPRDPPARHYMRTMPDFKKNPHKWTKYTLDDVKDEDMSDRGNTKAAFSFLNELRRRKTSEEMEGPDEEDSNRPPKIVFKKSTHPRKQHAPEEEEEAKSTFRSSKVIMPEYVVGQNKKKKEKRNKETQSSGGNKGLKLDHLFDEEED